MRPLEHIMTITQSQHLKPLDSSQDLKHAQQTQNLSDQNLKQKESVSKIPDNTQTDLMGGIRNGLAQQDPNSQHHHHDHHHEQMLKEEKVAEKEILDEFHGQNLDIMG
ncbi:MAG: hypothetical protein ACRCS8_02265 [Brevinema sp.]